MADPRSEHHVKPIAWVWAAGIVAASIGGAVFVTQWKPMTRTRVGTPVPIAQPKAYRLPMDRPNLPIPLANDPAQPESALYLGVSRLLGGDAPGAIDSLNAAVRLSSGRAEQDARWYLAVALERAGRVPDALSVLDSLCSSVPGTVPGTSPGTVPGTSPGTVPGTSPGTVPGTAGRAQQACAGAAALRAVSP